jgi:TolB protein
MTIMKRETDRAGNVLMASFIFLTLVLGIRYSKGAEPGIFDGHTDIGNVKLSGSMAYNPERQEFTLQGSGENIWFDKDEFHFLWKCIKGNFIMRARGRFIGEGVHEHRKIGLMIRDSLTTNAAHISAVVHGDGLASLQYRKNAGNITEETKSESAYPDIIQIERKGDTFIMSVATFGEPFETVKVTGIEINDEVFAGLFICSHNSEVLEKAVFDNVRIIIPAEEDFIPYTDFIGSNIEILDIESGLRKVLYSSPFSLQAPNWTNDGKRLIYNSKGLLFGFDIQNKTIQQINTDFANNNNNDHVLSFDNRLLGISHHSREDEDNSIVYTLPAEGGKPERITAEGPSYLHGWSPDGEYLAYTGGRDGNYDIYKISRNRKQEIRLTRAPGLDDGSEYTPDGKYIFFNSNRTGTMQIWRMRPDGSMQEQVTFDELNDWFPHISPDGKWIVFLSFSSEVKSDDHPFYKHVYIRLMPADGGKPKIIAYVYGGQGTINVPSWSPDSKKIAFISNTKVEE